MNNRDIKAKDKIYYEVTTLTSRDLFVLLDAKKAKFDLSTHFHDDYEISLILNCSGRRVVGDLEESFDEVDLVLVGPRVPHGWQAPYSPSNRVVTLHFDEKFTNAFTVEKNILQPIYDMLMRSSRGVRFKGEVLEVVKEKILRLCETKRFSSMLLFCDVLNTLAEAPLSDQELLVSEDFDGTPYLRHSKGDKVDMICKYIDEHFDCDITLEFIASLVNMTTTSVSHFFKHHTNRTFSNYLTDVRIGNASRMLAETTRSVNEIAEDCGFANISNFNRIFKRYKNQTPREYRTTFSAAIKKY